MANIDIQSGLGKFFVSIGDAIKSSNETEADLMIMDIIPDDTYFKGYYDVSPELGKAILDQFMESCRIQNENMKMRVKNERSKIIIYYWLLIITAIVIGVVLFVAYFAINKGYPTQGVWIISLPLSSMIWILTSKIKLH